MKRDFEHALRRARVRCGLNLLVALGAPVLTAAGLVALVLVLLERLLGIQTIQAHTAYGLAAGSCAALAALWWLRRPRRMEVAVLVDERLGLKERFSSCLALADRDDPFARAACAEARRRAREVTVAEHFPIRLDRHWAIAAVVWAVAAGIGLWLPQQDWLGRLRAEQSQQEQVKQQREAQEAVVQAVKPLEQLARQMGDEALAEELKQIAEQAQAPEKPAALKRQAIRKLDSLAEQLKQQLQTQKVDEAMALTQQMLKQLRPVANDTLRQIQQALAKGQFAKAAALLRQLQEQIANGELDEAQKAALAEQLEAMAKQIQAMAAKRKALESELQRLGLDPALAQLSPQALQQALQKMSLSPQQIARLMQAASACQGACRNADQLAGAMAAAAANGAGMTADDLAGLIGQADQMADMLQQMQLTEAMIQQLYASGQCLGQGMGMGPGAYAPWRAGSSNRRGPGTGGPGQGYGARRTGPDAPTQTQRTTVKSPTGEGPIVASFFFKGDQIKGQAMRDYKDVVTAGRDMAAEAIANNEIPRKYAESVKQYFSRLESQAPTGGSERSPSVPANGADSAASDIGDGPTEDPADSPAGPSPDG